MAIDSGYYIAYHIVAYRIDLTISPCPSNWQSRLSEAVCSLPLGGTAVVSAHRWWHPWIAGSFRWIQAASTWLC